MDIETKALVSARLHDLVNAVAPIHSVRIGRYGDPATVEVVWIEQPTEDQAAQARAIFAAFDWLPPVEPRTVAKSLVQPAKGTLARARSSASQRRRSGIARGAAGDRRGRRYGFGGRHAGLTAICGRSATAL